MKLALGFVAVRCRTPKELALNISLEDVRRLESELFASHRLLRQLRKDLTGTDTLAAKIVDLQAQVRIQVHRTESDPHYLDENIQTVQG